MDIFPNPITVNTNSHQRLTLISNMVSGKGIWLIQPNCTELMIVKCNFDINAGD